MGARRQDYQRTEARVRGRVISAGQRAIQGGYDTTSTDVEPVPAVRVLTRPASSVAAGRHHNRRPTGPVKLPGMALGLTRRTRAHPVDLENLAYAAHEFREALIPLQGITPDRCDAAATELRNRALVAEERFFAAVASAAPVNLCPFWPTRRPVAACRPRDRSAWSSGRTSTRARDR